MIMGSFEKCYFYLDFRIFFSVEASRVILRYRIQTRETQNAEYWWGRPSVEPTAAGSHQDGAASGSVRHDSGISFSTVNKVARWGNICLAGGSGLSSHLRTSFPAPYSSALIHKSIHKSASVSKAPKFPLDLQLRLSPPTPSPTFTCSQSLIAQWPLFSL